MKQETKEFLMESQKRIHQEWIEKRRRMRENNPNHQPVRDDENYPTLMKSELIELLSQYEDMPVYIDNAEYECLVGLTKAQIKLKQDDDGPYLVLSEDDE